VWQQTDFYASAVMRFLAFEMNVKSFSLSHYLSLVSLTRNAILCSKYFHFFLGWFVNFSFERQLHELSYVNKKLFTKRDFILVLHMKYCIMRGDKYYSMVLLWSKSAFTNAHVNHRIISLKQKLYKIS
jgi:hypothetical protein